MKIKIFFIVAICTLSLSASSIAEYKIVLTPSLSIDTEYTHNVDLSEDDRESDYVIVTTPGLDFEVSKKSRGVIISYEPGYSQYFRKTEYNTFRHSANLSAWTDISRRTKLNFHDSFSRSEEPITETDTTIRRGREPYYTNSARLNLTHQLGKSDSISLGYVFSILENKDPDIEDNVKHNPSIGFSHTFNPYMSMNTQISYIRGEFDGDDDVDNDIEDDFDQWNGSLQLTRKFTKYLDGFVQYSHTHMDFEGDSEDPEGENEDYQIYDPSIGINYTIAEGTFLSLSVGYFYRDRKYSSDNSGLTVNGDIGKTWALKRGSVNITGASGYDESYFGAENLGFNLYKQVRSAANYRFTRTLSGDIYASYRITDYKDVEDDREDKNTTAGLGLTYTSRIRWLPFSIGISYEYISVDSTQSENDYEDNRVQFNISMNKTKTFSKPIRLN